MSELDGSLSVTVSTPPLFVFSHMHVCVSLTPICTVLLTEDHPPLSVDREAAEEACHLLPPPPSDHMYVRVLLVLYTPQLHYLHKMWLNVCVWVGGCVCVGVGGCVCVCVCVWVCACVCVCVCVCCTYVCVCMRVWCVV